MVDEEFIRFTNENLRPFVWTRNVDAILEMVAHCKAVIGTPQCSASDASLHSLDGFVSSTIHVVILASEARREPF